jgi:hypothetical protein
VPKKECNLPFWRGIAMTGKDWVTIILSTLAFLLSAGTAYFNIVRQEDNVSVTFGRVPSISISETNDRFLIVEDEVDLILINSGNRGVAISGLAMFVMQHDQHTRCKTATSGNDGAWFTYKIEPFIVKANDLEAKRLRIAQPYSSSETPKNKSGQYTFPFEEINKGRPEALIEICFAVFFTTPGQSRGVEFVSGFKYKVTSRGYSYNPVDMARPPWNVPRILIKSWSSYFGS